MDTRYIYGHRPGRRRRTRVFIVLGISVLVIGIIGGLVYLDIHKNTNKTVSGESHTVVQALDENTSSLSIDQPTYTMELPEDWKQVDHQDTRYEHSTTWKSTKSHEDNRFLKVYVDIIPTTKSVNRLLPVSPDASKGLTTGDVSPSCHTFTQGGSQLAAQAQQLADAPAKYQNIDFICNRARITANEVGTSSTEGVNTVTIKGSAGSHKYFFLFTDNNIQPNFTIFTDALRSFKAK